MPGAWHLDVRDDVAVFAGEAPAHVNRCAIVIGAVKQEDRDVHAVEVRDIVHGEPSPPRSARTGEMLAGGGEQARQVSAAGLKVDERTEIDHRRIEDGARDEAGAARVFGES